jgi:hypothetical protein
MRKYTNRQIQEESVKEASQFLECIIKNMVEKSEILLKYNGTKNQRITKDCIKAVIKSEYYTFLPLKVGGIKKEKKNDIFQSLDSEVI